MESWARQYSAHTYYAKNYFEVHTLPPEDVAKLVASSRAAWPEYEARGPLAQKASDIIMEYFEETEEAQWFR
jgi:hypothetical protein